ncbi:MAG: choice-of-anchor D domain-containing protein [Candidatus Acidiferrales bacterium]
MNNLIQGAGEIGNNGLVFTNQVGGTVNANDSNGNPLLIDNASTNLGLYEATGKGVLEVTAAINNQSGNITATGSTATVEIYGSAPIQGGTITNSGGTLETPGGANATLDGTTHGQLTIVGTYTGQNNSDTTLVGTINNTGTLLLSSAANNTQLEIDAAVTLTGGGTLTMMQGSSTGGRPYINQEASGSLTNVNNLIQGAGEIGNNGLAFTNQAAGVVNANDPSGNPIAIDNASTNLGLYEATGTGVLELTAGVTNTGANIKAIGSTATAEISGSAAIHGGTITSSGGATFETPAGLNATLDGTATYGQLTIVGTYTGQNNSDTTLMGTINNTGTLVLSAAGNNTQLEIDAAVILTGGGTLTMMQGGAGRPYINQEASGSLTNMNNMIQGAGEIGNNGLVFTNQAGGVVNANDTNGNPILIDNASTNLGLYEATGKGVLEVTAAINNQTGNITVIGSTATAELYSSAPIQGGTITNNGGTFETPAGLNATLDGSTHGQLTLVGTYTGLNNSDTTLVGTINNTGTLLLSSVGNNTQLEMDGAVTLTGSGTLTMMQGGAGRPYINQEASGSLTNMNNLIQGAGEIGNNGLVFTNQAGGTVNANDPNGNPILIDNASTNLGLIEATGKGLLEITAAINNQSGNITVIGSTATAELYSSAPIQGGTITNNGGTFETPAGLNATLDGSTHGQLTIVGTYTGLNNSDTTLVGTINNTGTLLLSSAANNTQLEMDGAVTLTGGGTLTMMQSTGGRPYINQEAAGSLTNVNNTIQGAGEIGNNGLVFTNQAAGVVNANDTAGHTLLIDSANPFTNLGLVESTGSGVMEINTPISNSGTVLPDGSPNLGTISVAGGNTYAQTASGAYDVVLAGTTETPQNSVLSVGGNASLNGALNIELNGLTPMSGNQFTVLTAGSITGTFSSINSPSLGSGLGWTVMYNTESVVLMVTTSSAGSFALNVSDLGTGSGVVTDDLGQIDCTDTAGVVTGNCSGNYQSGSVVNLTATATSPSTFAGWGGACTSSGTTSPCPVTMSAAQSVSASFTPPPTTITLPFAAGSNVTETAAFDCPSNANPCMDPNAHSLTLMVPTVNSPFTLAVTATEVPLSQANGDCENGNTVLNDLDCRFTSYFTYEILEDGDAIVPQCDAYANGNCVFYSVYYCVPQEAGPCLPTRGQEPPSGDYASPVLWTVTWNYELFLPPTNYPYQTTPRLYDDPDYEVSTTTPYGTDCTTPMNLAGSPTSPAIYCQFVFDITTFFNQTPGVIDSGIGGYTRQFNDVIVAFPLGSATAAPNLSLQKTADATSVTVGSTIGFTITVSNSTNAGTGTAEGVTINDPLPAGTGVDWTISPAYTGQGTCTITGAVGTQVLSCSIGNLAPAIGASVHVSSGTSGNATLANTATVTSTNNATLTSSATITVGGGATTFTGLTASQSIPYGTGSVTLGGIISNGSTYPVGGTVSISIDSIAVSATVGTGGVFSAPFSTAAIPASSTPYVITYSFAGETNFPAVTDTSTTLTVTPASQTITFPAVASTAIYNSSFGVSATASSGLLVTITPSGVCSLSSGTVTMTSGTGTCMLTASQAGNTDYSAAGSISQTVTAQKASSTTTITSNTPSTSTAGNPVSVGFLVAGGGTPTGSVTVTATQSPNTVTCSGLLSGGAGSCSVTLSTAGMWTLTASYGGDTNFNGSSTTAGTTQTVIASTSSLTVSFAGSGSGSVFDSGQTIECTDTAGIASGTCSAPFSTGFNEMLTASPTSPSTFGGWGGAAQSCGTSLTCTVQVNGAENVTASFVPLPVTVILPPFTPSSPAQTAPFNCPSNTNPCTDPNAHSVTLSVPSVTTPFTMVVTATEVPLSQANGDCEMNNTVLNDFDCRFTNFFNYGSDGSGGSIVPQCDAYANGNCVFYSVYYCVPSGSTCTPTPGQEPPASYYEGPVAWTVTWNNEAYMPPAIYQANNLRLFDDPDSQVNTTDPYGTSCTTAMDINGSPTSPAIFCQFVYDITTFFNPTEPVIDSGIGGYTRQFNDVVVAFPAVLPPSVTNTPDATTVTLFGGIGFTDIVTNPSTTTALSNVTLSDPLPAGTGVDWTISPIYSGPGTCAITGAVGSQLLTCSISSLAAGATATVHVTSATAGAGQYENIATVTVNGNETVLSISSITVQQATTAFLNLSSSQSITYGTSTIMLKGTIAAGSLFPPSTETVTITIGPASQIVTIGASGSFLTTTFPTTAIPASTSPYTISYSYAGDPNFTSAVNVSTTLTVNKAASTTTITSNLPNPSMIGQTVTIGFTVAGAGTPTGSVTVNATTGESCNGTLASGAGSCTIVFSTSGSRTLTATYSGDTNFSSGVSVGVSQSVNPSASSSISAFPSSVNFGTVYFGQIFLRNVTLTNASSGAIKITSVTTNSPGNAVNEFIPVSFCLGTLGAGKSCLIIVGFVAVTPNQDPAGTLIVTYNAAGSPLNVPLSATVINPRATLNPNSLNFGKQNVGTPSAAQKVTLTSTGTTALDLSTLSYGGSFGPADGTTCMNGETLQPAATCFIYVTFTPRQKGQNYGSVKITDNALSSPQVINLLGTGD